jgi:CRISPR/Cas system-associated endonuclease Cas1
MGADFRRDRDAEGANALLNYGYAVMRASVARAVIAAGLHPSIGLHHKSGVNSFALADDLVEPFRPLVDAAVRHMVGQGTEAVGSTHPFRDDCIGCCRTACAIEHCGWPDYRCRGALIKRPHPKFCNHPSRCRHFQG